MSAKASPGREAVHIKGWWGAHRFLVLRRISQTLFLALFLIGPWFDFWIVEGTLAGSLTLGFLPLTDPFIALQSLAAGHLLETAALTGAVIVLAVYAFIGGRVFCSWVCPINPVTDAAYWLHLRLGLSKGWQPKRATRRWLVGTVLIVSAFTGTIAWELVNPITIVHRGLVFGLGAAWGMVAAIFLFDLVVARRGWCSHLCPVGAFFGFVGIRSVARVSAAGRARCDDCMDCYAVCPEAHVIAPALKAASGASPLILAPDCTNCGRCIDVCAEDVFRFTHRFETGSADSESAVTRRAA